MYRYSKYMYFMYRAIIHNIGTQDTVISITQQIIVQSKPAATLHEIFTFKKSYVTNRQLDGHLLQLICVLLVYVSYEPFFERDATQNSRQRRIPNICGVCVCV